MKLFIDSDVVISSLISSSGAASLLLHNTEGIQCFLSNISIQELNEVVKRLNLDKKMLKYTIDQRFLKITIPEKVLEEKQRYEKFVTDLNDIHIVAGAKVAQVRFLITYNIRDFKEEIIKDELNIITLTPGQFLQYLRSLK